jgi:hypothetical protein
LQAIPICSGTSALELTAWFLGSAGTSGYQARVCFGAVSNCSPYVTITDSGSWLSASVVVKPASGVTTVTAYLQVVGSNSFSQSVYADFVVVG